jgi:hypothetical protein
LRRQQENASQNVATKAMEWSTSFTPPHFEDTMKGTKKFPLNADCML